MMDIYTYSHDGRNLGGNQSENGQIERMNEYPMHAYYYLFIALNISFHEEGCLFLKGLTSSDV
jgi:hypothetical protein